MPKELKNWRFLNSFTSSCVSPLLWIDWVDFTWVWRSNSHPCLLTHLCSLLCHCDHWLLSLSSPPFLLSSHVSALCSFLHFGPLPPFCLPTSSTSPSSPSSLSHRTFLPCPSVPAPVLFYPLPLLSWSPPRTVTASPSLCSSFRYISLGAIQPANTFYGLNPFSHCVFTGLGQVLICLSLFLPSLASSLSLASLSLSPCSSTDGSSHSLSFSFSFTHLTPSFPTSYFLSFFLNLCITLSLCLFCLSSLCYLMFSSTTPLHPLRFFLFLSPMLPPHYFRRSIPPSSSLDSFCLSSYTFMAYTSLIQYVSTCLSEEAVLYHLQYLLLLWFPSLCISLWFPLSSLSAGFLSFFISVQSLCNCRSQQEIFCLWEDTAGRISGNIPCYCCWVSQSKL